MKIPSQLLRQILKILYRLFFVAIMIAIAVVLYRQSKSIDWDQVVSVIGEYSLFTFVAAIVLVGFNYLAFVGYDVLAKRYTAHSIKRTKTMIISFVCYVFNFNLGAVIGSGGLKFKLYSEQGLRASLVAKIISFCIATHWLGYFLLAGLVLIFQDVTFPPGIRLSENIARVIGVLFVFVPVGYGLVCVYSTKSSFRFFSKEIEIPELSTALLQITLSTLNWGITACLLFVVFRGKIDFLTISQAFLLSSVMAAVVHIPAGLGVLESVFVALLANHLTKEDIVAYLLAYRVLFYLLPFAVAAVLYFAFEIKQSSKRSFT